MPRSGGEGVGGRGKKVFDRLKKTDVKKKQNKGVLD